jgi:hypothetical protein
MSNSRIQIITAALAAAMTPGTIGVVPIVARQSAPEPFFALDYAPRFNGRSPNGGRRYTTAQARRAATKRRNRLRAKGQHRKAVR